MDSYRTPKPPIFGHFDSPPRTLWTLSVSTRIASGTLMEITQKIKIKIKKIKQKIINK